MRSNLQRVNYSSSECSVLKRKKKNLLYPGKKPVKMGRSVTDSQNTVIKVWNASQRTGRVQSELTV